MSTVLESLLVVQSVEQRLAHVRRRLRARKNAVKSQAKRIEGFQEEWKALHERSLLRRASADRYDLDLKDKEAQVAKLRTSLNTAKTNKEYASILTQINTYKADNARVEEDALRIMQDVDAINAEAAEVQAKIAEEERRLEEIGKTSQEEVDKLEGMLEQLTAQRIEAARAVPQKTLSIFDRIAESYDGEGMAPVEIHGRKPPHTYVCGGCFMTLNAEHANALMVRDEVRTCDNCGRILYFADQADGSAL